MNEHALASLVEPILATAGLELDRMEIVRAGKRSVLRFYLDGDGPQGQGPSLDEIAEATRAISAVLDAADITKGRPYTLEVSSRGVSRPLTHPRHFRRNTGRLVELTLAEGTVTGRVLAADEESVEVEVDGTRRRVALADVRRALVQVELNRPVEGEDTEEEAEV